MDNAVISFPILGDGFKIDIPGYFSIFGFRIYFYGLFITAGFILAALYLYKRRDVLKLTQDNVLDLVIMAVPCGLVGARLYYIIFNPTIYFGAGKWQNIFNIREGGLAVYGGVIGGAIAFYVYSRVKKVPVGRLWDAAGFGLFIGQAVGRWGNFFNREAFGVETNLPWRMRLTPLITDEYSKPFGDVHPTFLYESLWNVIGLVLLHIFSKKVKTKYNGQYFILYVAWYGLGRFMIEGLRTDSLYIYGTGLRVSQVLAAVSCLGAVTILLRNYITGYTSKELVAAADGAADAEDAADVDAAEDKVDKKPEGQADTASEKAAAPLKPAKDDADDTVTD